MRDNGKKQMEYTKLLVNFSLISQQMRRCRYIVLSLYRWRVSGCTTPGALINTIFSLFIAASHAPVIAASHETQTLQRNKSAHKNYGVKYQMVQNWCLLQAKAKDWFTHCNIDRGLIIKYFQWILHIYKRWQVLQWIICKYHSQNIKISPL